jgi:Glycosyltransferase family 20
MSELAVVLAEFTCTNRRTITPTAIIALLSLLQVKGTSLPLTQRLALYKCSDVLACTAVREGLNLTPLEYIYSRRDPDPPGVVLASEFSACSSLLNGAIRINPFDVQRVAAALDQVCLHTACYCMFILTQVLILHT